MKIPTTKHTLIAVAVIVVASPLLIGFSAMGFYDACFTYRRTFINEIIFRTDDTCLIGVFRHV